MRNKFQVSWANDIRDRIIQQVREEFSEAEKRQDANPFYSNGPDYDTLSNFAYNEYRRLYNEVEQKYREGKKQGRDKKELYKEFNRNLKKQMEDMFKNILKTQTTAKWWIDRRNH